MATNWKLRVLLRSTDEGGKVTKGGRMLTNLDTNATTPNLKALGEAVAGLLVGDLDSLTLIKEEAIN